MIRNCKIVIQKYRTQSKNKKARRIQKAARRKYSSGKYQNSDAFSQEYRKKGSNKKSDC
jgi:hypothetical protein